MLTVASLQLLARAGAQAESPQGPNLEQASQFSAVLTSMSRQAHTLLRRHRTQQRNLAHGACLRNGLALFMTPNTWPAGVAERTWLAVLHSASWGVAGGGAQPAGALAIGAAVPGFAHAFLLGGASFPVRDLCT